MSPLGQLTKRGLFTESEPIVRVQSLVIELRNSKDGLPFASLSSMRRFFARQGSPSISQRLRNPFSHNFVTVGARAGPTQLTGTIRCKSASPANESVKTVVFGGNW